MLGAASILTVIFSFFFFFFSYKQYVDAESFSGYECGFEIMSKTRILFSYRFFLLAILFLIFDVEVVLLLSAPFMGVSSFLFMFILILVGGLLYEYSCGSLDWL